MKRIIYFLYYLKNLDRKKFGKFIHFYSERTKISRLKLLFDAIVSTFKYKISLLEYFQFEFPVKDRNERRGWAGTGYMYEYQRLMNPPKARKILDEKSIFFKAYAQLIKHNIADIPTIMADPEHLQRILNNPSGKIVFKVSNGKCGANVLIKRSDEFNTNDEVLSFMKKRGYDLIEEFIIQHTDFMKLSPSAVNTVRIFTQLNVADEVEILGCRLRISINSTVDNMAAGNIAAPIDELTGIVNGAGVYSDITKPPEIVHPVSGIHIVGFQVPFWPATIRLVHDAARLHPQNRSVGWDIAMKQTGPDIIEGNHDWCKLVWQLPVGKGMKSVLEKHRTEYLLKRQ